jgi:hypothetical protein
MVSFAGIDVGQVRALPFCDHGWLSLIDAHVLAVSAFQLESLQTHSVALKMPEERKLGSRYIENVSR